MKIDIYIIPKAGEGIPHLFKEDMPIWELDELELPMHLFKPDVVVSFSINRSCEKCQGKTYTEITCEGSCEQD